MWGRKTTTSFFLPYLLSSAVSAAAASTTTTAFTTSCPLPAFLLRSCRPTATTTTVPAAFTRHPMTTMTTTTITTSMSTKTTTAPPTQEKKTKILTLLFVRRTHPTTGVKEVLLGMKKRGFGLGKWNGFGGKVEPGETIEAAALRELEEESCLKADRAELRGKITFTFLTIPEILKVHVFEAIGPIVGEPQETEEMKPQWYAEKEIPYDKMWADDQYWVPLFLEGKRFKALFEFDDESTILRYDLAALKDEEEL